MNAFLVSAFKIGKMIEFSTGLVDFMGAVCCVLPKLAQGLVDINSCRGQGVPSSSDGCFVKAVEAAEVSSGSAAPQ